MFWFNLTHNRTHPSPHGHVLWPSLVLIGQYLQMLVSKQSDMANFLIQGQTTQDSSGQISSIIELIRTLVVIYILTKFGDDCFIFVDARVLPSKLRTEGRRTVSDHNSSLSTLFSGELKTRACLGKGFTCFC